MTNDPLEHCDGSCCALFTIPMHHEEVEEFRVGKRDASEWKDPDEVTNIMDMVIPLGREEIIERNEKYGKDMREDATNVYTCRHWNTETRLCGNYENRPQMCRDFPYDSECGSCDYCPPETIIDKWKKIHAKQEKAKNGE